MLLAAVLLNAALVGAVELASRGALYGGHHHTTAPAQRVPLGTPGSANCTTRYFPQTIDHFSWAGTPTGASTYQQRYLTYSEHWRNDSTGSVWFYVGNEGDVTLYADHTGLMWENSAAEGALLVFAEHRYYGLSQPFGDASSLYLQYLTHEQALADYAALLFALQAELGAGQQPVIVFGGSYGGMLAAWMRLKYPGAIAGAVSASAPVLFFEGTTPTPPGDFEQYWRVVTRDMTPAAGAAAACAPNVRAAWDAIDAAAAAGDLARLSDTFQLCTPLQTPSDVLALKIMHLNAWDTCAMGNYPYPSNYLTSGGPLLPAFPVQAMCSALANPALRTGDPWQLLAAFNTAGNVFNNATQNVQCYVLPTDLWLDGIWDYQYCTELLPEETYFGRDGVADAFWPFAYNRSAITAHCMDKFGVSPRFTWMAQQYRSVVGGSKIVYTSGSLDPWSAGGVLPGSPRDTPNTPAFLVEGGAHHLDLFFSNPSDPPSVTAIRKQQIALASAWAQEWRAAAAAGEL